jgi:hypothetical protein
MPIDLIRLTDALLTSTQTACTVDPGRNDLSRALGVFKSRLVQFLNEHQRFQSTYRSWQQTCEAELGNMEWQLQQLTGSGLEPALAAAPGVRLYDGPHAHSA